MRIALVSIAALCTAAAAQDQPQSPTIRTLRFPDSGIQPQAVMAADGTLHPPYYNGDPQAGDLSYLKRSPAPPASSGKSEPERRVFIATSSDDGATFAPERAISPADLGACGCCGLKAFASTDGAVHILFRAAARGVDRDTIWLRSADHAATFVPSREHP